MGTLKYFEILGTLRTSLRDMKHGSEVDMQAAGTLRYPGCLQFITHPSSTQAESSVSHNSGCNL